jgi:hypothetical protein
MTDENSPHGAGDKDQDLDAERAVAEAPATGDARVDDAVAGLSRLRGRPAEEHVAVLEEVHGRLRDILDDLGPSGAEHAPPGDAPAGGSGGGVPPGHSPAGQQ